MVMLERCQKGRLPRLLDEATPLCTSAEQRGVPVPARPAAGGVSIPLDDDQPPLPTPAEAPPNPKTHTQLLEGSPGPSLPIPRGGTAPPPWSGPRGFPGPYPGRLPPS